MTPGTPAYSVWANLRWFTLVYLLGSLAVVVLIAIAEDAYEISLVAIDFALQVGMLASVMVEASRRFLIHRNNEWTSTDRRRLALGYAASSTILPTALGASIMAMSPEGRAELKQLLDTHWVVPVALILMSLITFGLAHLMLYFVDHGRKS